MQWPDRAELMDYAERLLAKARVDGMAMVVNKRSLSYNSPGNKLPDSPR